MDPSGEEPRKSSYSRIDIHDRATIGIGDDYVVPQTDRGTGSLQKPLRPASRLDFEIVIFCALSLEADAVEAVFDQYWDEHADGFYGKARGDHNSYSFGRIGQHDVVLVHLPSMGEVATTTAAVSCRSSFPNAKLAFDVGICGAAPNTRVSDIWLGDVLISDDVLSYDFGRQSPGSFVQKPAVDYRVTESAPEMRATLAMLKGIRGQSMLKKRTKQYLTEIQKIQELRADFPGRHEDRLFHPNYDHLIPGTSCEESLCAFEKLILRRPRSAGTSSESQDFETHFGSIASGHAVVRSAEHRDALAMGYGVIGFDLDVIGMCDVFSSILIRGACNYADSHPAKRWQPYAAATAAACMKAFLTFVQPTPRASSEVFDTNVESEWETSSVGSVGSSTSTLVGSSASVPFQSGLQQAVAILIDNEDLSMLFRTAIQKPDTDMQRFRRNLVRILASLGADLTLEASTMNEIDSALFFRRYRVPIAMSVSKRVDDMLPEMIVPAEPEEANHTRTAITKAKEMPSGDRDDESEAEFERVGGDDEETASESVEEVDFDFGSVKAFILSSEAFQRMMKRLSDFVNPSFFSHAQKLVEAILKDKDMEHDRYWSDMGVKMRLILTELEESRPMRVMLDLESDVSRIEKLMNGIESLTREKWNWWPLSPPKSLLGPSEVRLSWLCRCKETRCENVPAAFAGGIARLVQKYPFAGQKGSGSQTNTTGAPSSSSGSTINPSLGTRAINNPGGSVSNISKAHQNTQTQNQGTNHMQTQGQDQGQDKPQNQGQGQNQGGTQNQTNKPRYIFLAATSRETSIHQIPSTYLRTDNFGIKLRKAYYKSKGFWWWLSMYGYSHCDFHYFEKYRPNGYAVRLPGIPPTTSNDYYYNPRPANCEPPISPEEFKHLFDHAARQKHPSWTTALPFFNTVINLSNDTVHRIPQRYFYINQNGPARDFFWGLHIRERRSVVMTLLYAFLCVCPTIIFAVLFWLGHISGDIQNATTPFALAMTLLALFFGSLIKQ